SSCWKPPASSVPPSAIAPAGPATPSSTLTSSSATWSRGQTVGGRHRTAATSTHGRRPPAPSTSPPCGPSWPPLGLRWQVRRNGLGELADIPKNILRAFSKRRADIEAAMDERGVTSAAAGEMAALATRARKPDETAPFDLLREGWKAQLAEIPYPDGEGGHHPATPGDLVLDATARGSTNLPEPDQVEAVFRVLAGEGRVSLDDWEIDEQLAPDTRAMPVTLFGSTFTRRDAICAVAR